MTQATIDIVRKTGSSGAPTVTTITTTSTRASTSDVASPGAANPIPIPGAGTNYSFWVATRMKVTANPDGHTVNNVKWYAATALLPTGVTCIGNNATSYVQATGTTGTTGNQLTTGNYATLSANGTDVFAFTSASTKSLGSGSTSSTGEVADHFVYQFAVDTTATAVSPAPANTFVYRYDEA